MIQGAKVVLKMGVERTLEIEVVTQGKKRKDKIGVRPWE